MENNEKTNPIIKYLSKNVLVRMFTQSDDEYDNEIPDLKDLINNPKYKDDPEITCNESLIEILIEKTPNTFKKELKVKNIPETKVGSNDKNKHEVISKEEKTL